MKKFLLIAAASLALCATVPASAQVVYFGAGPGGAGVGVADPDYSWRHRHWHRGYGAYARGDCRVIRERVVTSYGRVFYRTREICG